MSVHGRQRKAALKTQLDRRLWSGLDNTVFNVRVKGTGQHLMPEPLYFGQAFDRPPAFTYSAVASDAAVVGPEAKSLTRLHPDFIAAHESDPKVYGDTLASQGLFVDSSFEHQMIFDDATIPALYEVWGGTYQKIQHEQESGTTYPIRPGTWTNGWVQGFETNSRWEVSDERYNPIKPPDREGRYSAKYTFDAAGNSRWLYPAAGEDLSPFWSIREGDEDYQRFECVSHLLGVSGHFEGGLGDVQGPFKNPEADVYTYEIHTYSTEDCSLEFNWAGWDTNGDLGGDQNFLAGVPNWDGTVRMIQERSYTRRVEAGTWQRHVFDVRWPHWPNAPIDPSRINEIATIPGWVYDDPMYATVRWRFTDGIVGQKVYVDDVFGYLNLQTAPPTALITIGVAEWIQDELGMYVGARLWFRAESEGDILAI